MSAHRDMEVEAIELLRKLIQTPSFSKEEAGTAQIISEFLQKKGITCDRKKNNIWCCNKYFNSSKPTILLNSHHDTVRPNKGYTRDPFAPDLVDRKLFGLGSNDAGGCVVSLIAAFIYFYNRKDLKYNLQLAITAEEENSGQHGLECVIPELGEIAFAIVGEPTQLDAAIAEKGLMVLDCYSHGKSGHAARDEGENAIYKAMGDIEWISKFKFPKTSGKLGPVKLTVTQIEAGTQHNVIPPVCHFVVDVRTTDAYTNDEVLAIISEHVEAEVVPRSTRLKPSAIEEDHPFIKAAKKLGSKTYGSPTTSDQALLSVPSVKMGPGDSARSHMADEFIFIDDITAGIARYINCLEAIV